MLFYFVYRFVFCKVLEDARRLEDLNPPSRRENAVTCYRGYNIYRYPKPKKVKSKIDCKKATFNRNSTPWHHYLYPRSFPHFQFLTSPFISASFPIPFHSLYSFTTSQFLSTPFIHSPLSRFFSTPFIHSPLPNSFPLLLLALHFPDSFPLL